VTLSKALNSCAFQYLFQDFQNMKIYMPHVENDDVISLEVSLLEGGNILYSIRIGLSAKIIFTKHANVRVTDEDYRLGYNG
jgi:uncharacterized UPF0146 family protein